MNERLKRFLGSARKKVGRNSDQSCRESGPDVILQHDSVFLGRVSIVDHSIGPKTKISQVGGQAVVSGEPIQIQNPKIVHERGRRGQDVPHILLQNVVVRQDMEYVVGVTEYPITLYRSTDVLFQMEKIARDKEGQVVPVQRNIDGNYIDETTGRVIPPNKIGQVVPKSDIMQKRS